MAFRVAYQGPISETLSVFKKLCEWGSARQEFQEVAARQTVWVLPKVPRSQSEAAAEYE